jgi:hypothetical protein
MRRLQAGSFVFMIGGVRVSANFPLASVVAVGQETAALPDATSATQTQLEPPNPIQHDDQHEPSKNHIVWIIPNYRSDENSGQIKALRPAEKMRVSLDDSFDPPAFLVAGIFAGLYGAKAVQLFRYPAADRSFGNTASKCATESTEEEDRATNKSDRS